MEKIDAGYLKGLKMTGGTTEIVEKNGRKTRKATPWERPATPEDVLSWTDYGTYVVIALNDGNAANKGQKYRVEKNPKKDMEVRGRGDAAKKE